MIVTGASSGIGLALAHAASRAGFAIVAVARRKERLDALAAEIARDGGACVPVVLDVTQPDAPARIVATALERFGRIDVLVNNAGRGAAGNLLDQSDAAIDAQWQLHVAAPLRISRAALDALRASGGHLMFVGSGVVHVPPPGFGAYSAAKGAIRTAAAQLRRELRGSGVAVTYVDPGTVDTEFSQASGLRRRAPRGLQAKPKDVAARMLRAVRTRPGTLRAVPWQSVAVAIGEMFPSLADRFLPRVADTPASAPVAAPEAAPTPNPQPGPAPAAHSEFERALEPVARRMERVKLAPAFLQEMLAAGGDVHLSDAAMRWAGMPNKNERAAMAEALDALAAGGFLERTGEETWRVVRAAQ